MRPGSRATAGGRRAAGLRTRDRVGGATWPAAGSGWADGQGLVLVVGRVGYQAGSRVILQVADDSQLLHWRLSPGVLDSTIQLAIAPGRLAMAVNQAASVIVLMGSDPAGGGSFLHDQKETHP